MQQSDPDAGRDDRDSLWDGFWSDLRRDYASLWPEFLDGLREGRELWREAVAEFRQDRQFTRRMKQRITGVDNPTRRQWRDVCKAYDTEAREIEQAERRVLREFDSNQGGQQ
jgi:hypothetical protein